jgi:hypothetical protein
MALRAQHPESYADAVMLFSRVLPSNSNALKALKAQYLEVKPAAITAAKRSLEVERVQWRQAPPFALYRGHILQRPLDFGFEDVPFEPFSDPALLILAVRLLDLAK